MKKEKKVSKRGKSTGIFQRGFRQKIKGIEYLVQSMKLGTTKYVFHTLIEQVQKKEKIK